jgi:hypothetical protein
MFPVGGVARAWNTNHLHQHHQHRIPAQLMLIVTIGPLPDALKPGNSLRWNALDPGFHGVSN